MSKSDNVENNIRTMEALCKVAIQVPNMESYLKPGVLVLSYAAYFVVLEVFNLSGKITYRAYNFDTQVIFYSNYILHGEFVVADDNVYIIKQDNQVHIVKPW